jgi:hypothetical protein
LEFFGEIETHMRESGKTRLHLLMRPEVFILALIAASYLLVWPVGDYAFNDDWAYFTSLERLADNGRIEILDWNPMSLVGHLVWGELFTALFGFSFTVTKLSVVALAMIESVVLLRLLRWCGVASGLAVIAVAAVFFNPVHFVHVFSFQTDVPAVAWEVVAVFCYVRAIGESVRPRPGWLLGGALAVAQAYLIRQSAVVIPAALAVYVLACERKRWRAGACAAAFLPACLVIAGFQIWYQGIHGETAAFREASAQVMQFIRHPPVADLPEILFSYFIYLGLFCLPLLPAVARSVWRAYPVRQEVAWLAIVWGVVNAFALSVMSERVFPYVRNVLTPYGFYLPNELFVGDRELLWGEPIAWLIAVASFVSGCCLARRLVSPPTQPATSYAGVARRLLTVLFIFHLAYFTATSPLLFDRHLLPLAPICAGLCCIPAPLGATRPKVWPCTACLVPMALYSVIATHDVHRLSQAGFQAADELVRSGADPLTVNGGYAFDGWLTYEIAPSALTPALGDVKWWKSNVWEATKISPTRFSRWTLDAGQGWWYGRTRPDKAPKYVVASSPAPLDTDARHRFAELPTREYQRWWPWRRERVYVYEVRAE